MSKDSIKSFRTAFGEFLKEENLEHTYKQKQVINKWEQIMGKTIASRTSKIFFRDRTMFVKLTSAPLKQEMHNSQEKILKLVSDEIGQGEVTEVRFL